MIPRNDCVNSTGIIFPRNEYGPKTPKSIVPLARGGRTNGSITIIRIRNLALNWNLAITNANGIPNIEISIVEIVAVVRLNITESNISVLFSDSTKFVGSITKSNPKNGYIIYNTRINTKTEMTILNPDMSSFLKVELTITHSPSSLFLENTIYVLE